MASLDVTAVPVTLKGYVHEFASLVVNSDDEVNKNFSKESNPLFVSFTLFN